MTEYYAVDRHLSYRGEEPLEFPISKYECIKELKKIKWYRYQNEIDTNIFYIVGFDENNCVKFFLAGKPWDDKNHYWWNKPNIRNIYCFILELRGNFNQISFGNYSDEDSEINTRALCHMLMLPRIINPKKMRFRNLPRCITRSKNYFRSQVTEKQEQKMLNNYFADKL